MGTDSLCCVICAISQGISRPLKQHQICMCRQLSHAHGPARNLLEDAVSLWSSCTKPLWKEDGKGHEATHSLGFYTPDPIEQMDNLSSKGKIQKEISHPCSFEGL